MISLNNSTTEKLNLTINSVIDRLDLSDELKENKKLILRDWEEAVNDSDTFQSILEICNKFNYYSPNITSETYDKLFLESKIENENFDKFVNSAFFMPLRRHSRIETSLEMVSQFRLTNNINISKIYLDGPIVYMKKYFLRYIEIMPKIETLEADVSNLNRIISNLKKQAKSYEKDINIYKKITKEIEKNEYNLNKIQVEMKHTIEEFNNKYFRVKNIVIIDDFIGTGDSGVKFLKKLSIELKKLKTDINFHLWVLESSEDGLNRISAEAKKLGINLDIKYGRMSMSVLDGVSSNSEELKTKLNDLMRSYRIPISRYSLNHALSTYVNAPNNNLALLSNKGDNWTPLFLRIKRVEEKIIINTEETKDIILNMKRLKK